MNCIHKQASKLYKIVLYSACKIILIIVRTFSINNDSDLQHREDRSVQYCTQDRRQFIVYIPSI